MKDGVVLVQTTYENLVSLTVFLEQLFRRDLEGVRGFAFLVVAGGLSAIAQFAFGLLFHSVLFQIGFLFFAYLSL